MFCQRWYNRFQRVRDSDDGPTAVEYAVLLALIVVACVGAVNNMANATRSSFDTTDQAIAQAMGG